MATARVAAMPWILAGPRCGLVFEGPDHRRCAPNAVI